MLYEIPIAEDKNRMRMFLNIVEARDRLIWGKVLKYVCYGIDGCHKCVETITP